MGGHGGARKGSGRKNKALVPGQQTLFGGQVSDADYKERKAKKVLSVEDTRKLNAERKIKDVREHEAKEKQEEQKAATLAAKRAKKEKDLAAA